MNKRTTVVHQPVVEEELETEVEDSVSIPLSDVKLVVNVIDVIAKRGGFAPADFKAVGELFEKLSVHLKK